MNRNRSASILSFALFSAHFCSASMVSKAQLDVVLTPTIFTAPSKVQSVITYQATFTNNFTFDLYLNGDFASVDSSLSLDDALFQDYFVFPTTPPVLLAGATSGPIDIFTVNVPSNTPSGSYQGVFTFIGGPGLNTNDVENLQELATNRFTVQNVVPEPGVVPVLVGFGVIVAGVFSKRRLKAKSKRA